MASIHVLEQVTKDTYRVAIHQAVPAGNNSAGFTWKSVLLAAGYAGTTILPEGNGVGQITTAEKTNVTAGDVIELVVVVKLLSGGTGNAAIGAVATKAWTDFRDELQLKLARYGQTVA